MASTSTPLARGLGGSGVGRCSMWTGRQNVACDDDGSTSGRIPNSNALRFQKTLPSKFRGQAAPPSADCPDRKLGEAKRATEDRLARSLVENAGGPKSPMTSLAALVPRKGEPDGGTRRTTAITHVTRRSHSPGIRISTQPAETGGVGDPAALNSPTSRPRLLLVQLPYPLCVLAQFGRKPLTKGKDSGGWGSPTPGSRGRWHGFG
ncbi:uncharacterized protein UV8b_01544 [Ustilaginoidea virens]|uniref:Uncharacterized protein n=1 Tax=Ustilaginoidea virens TaxID=1159556 RepID=A0A8E5HL41_USTVR|nr:uncharacterized protein UV8b_01544 [Ustilaginoidea virens]QUC17303.1 hypothetical protein UV8b_01544 [Ustilaginoidea virens]